MAATETAAFVSPGCVCTDRRGSQAFVSEDSLQYISSHALAGEKFVVHENAIRSEFVPWEKASMASGACRPVRNSAFSILHFPFSPFHSTFPPLGGEFVFCAESVAIAAKKTNTAV